MTGQQLLIIEQKLILNVQFVINFIQFQELVKNGLMKIALKNLSGC
jgi:hypothetical protein